MGRLDDRLRRLEAEEPALSAPAEFPDWSLDDQLAGVANTLRFRVGSHSNAKGVRYPATDREIHLLGLLCVFWERGKEGGEYTFEASGLTVELAPSEAGEEMVFRAPRRIGIDDLPEWILDHVERMDPEKQPERAAWRYAYRHRAKEERERWAWESSLEGRHEKALKRVEHWRRDLEFLNRNRASLGLPPKDEEDDRNLQNALAALEEIEAEIESTEE